VGPLNKDIGKRKRKKWPPTKGPRRKSPNLWMGQRGTKTIHIGGRVTEPPDPVEIRKCNLGNVGYY